MLFILVQKRDIFYIVNDPVNAHTYKAFALYTGQNISMLTFFSADKRRTNLDLSALWPLEYRIHYLRRVLTGNLPATYPAVRLTNPGKKQSKVVIDFRGGSHCRAWIAACTSLLNRNGRRQTCNVADGGLLHLLKELPSIGAQ